MRQLIFLFLILLTPLAWSPAHALYSDGLLVNWTTMNFDFKEFDEGGEVVHEKGILGGAEIEIGKGIGPVWLALRGSMLKGVANYDGEKALDGSPHQTKTEETIYDFSFEVGRNYETWNRHEFATIYAGLGFHQWIRDIKSKDGVVGLYERYTWAYANVGARGTLFSTTRNHFMIEINLLRTINPFLDVSFKGNFDDQRFFLGEHYGAKVSLPWRFEFDRRIMFYVEPYFEAWDLGFSNVQDATRDGFELRTTIQSPKNSSRYAGINLGLFLRFE